MTNKGIVTGSTLTDIADETRRILNSSSSYTPAQIATALSGLTTKGTATITPGASDQTIATKTVTTGVQTIKGDTNLVAANIVKDVTIFGVKGTYAGPSLTGDAAVANVLSGKTFYSNSYTKQTGTMANNGATGGTITSQNGTYTIPAGYTSGGTVEASLPNATFEVTGPDVNSVTSGYVPANTGVGTVASGTITNNTTLPSGQTSSGTINRSSYIKIGAGYYAADKYYLAQADAHSSYTPSSTYFTTTNTGYGTINANQYATSTYYIKGISGTLGGSASAGSVASGQSITTNPVITLNSEGNIVASYSGSKTITGSAGSYTPKYTVSTAGWLNSTVTGSAQSVSVSSATVTTSGTATITPASLGLIPTPTGNKQITSQGSSSSPVDVLNYAGAYVKGGTMSVKASTPSVTGVWDSTNNRYTVTATAPAPVDNGTQTAGWVSSVSKASGTSGTLNIAKATFEVSGASVKTTSSGAGYIPASTTVGTVSSMTLPTSTSSSGSGTSKLTVTPGTSNKYINIPTGYNSAAAYYTVSGSNNLTAANIKKNVTIFGVTGTYEGGGGSIQMCTAYIYGSGYQEGNLPATICFPQGMTWAQFGTITSERLDSVIVGMDPSYGATNLGLIGITSGPEYVNVNRGVGAWIVSATRLYEGDDLGDPVTSDSQIIPNHIYYYDYNELPTS